MPHLQWLQAPRPGEDQALPVFCTLIFPQPSAPRETHVLLLTWEVPAGLWQGAGTWGQTSTSTSHGSLPLSLLSFLPIVTFSLSTVFFFCISFSVIFHPALFSLYILPSHFFLSQISSTSTWQILIQHPLTDRHWCQSPSVPLPHLFHHPFIHLCSLTPSIHPSIQYLFRTHLSASACFFSISFLNPILAHLLHQLLADQAQKPSEGLKQRTRLLTPAKFVANVLDWSGTLKCIQNYQKWTTELDSQHQPRVAAWGWEGWCLLDGQ